MIYLATFLFGLLFGSFLNVCIYRLPRIHPQLTEQSLAALKGESLQAHSENQAIAGTPTAFADSSADGNWLKRCWRRGILPFVHFWGVPMTLKAEPLPAEILAKLEKLQNTVYITGNDFIAALEEQLGKESADRYGDLIFQAAAFNKESIVFPGSHCPHCQTPIKPWDNVPVVSFLLLGGQCRACHAKISWRYPAVELLTALLFAALVWQFGLTLLTVVYLGFVFALLAVSFIDLDHLIIPDQITLPGIVIGLLLSCWLPLPATVTHWYGSLLGAIVGGGIIALVGYIGAFVFKKEAMGGGDIKLMAMIGAFLGWKLALLTVFLGSFVGAIIGIILKLSSGREYIPFGPFLSLGAVITLFFGQELLFWYWHRIFSSFSLTILLSFINI